MRKHLFFIFLLLFGINSAAQELVGPNHAIPGNLVSFEIIPAQEASWYIVPPSLDAATYQIDTDLSKLYFASPEQGCYTVIAGIVIHSKPELLVKTFFNGEENSELLPRPFPVPPVSSLETWVKVQLPILVKSDNLVSESRLVAECFDQIIQRIEAENIKTVQNAQAQLQMSITRTLALASPSAITHWIPFLTELSQRLEVELGDHVADLADVKQKLQEIAIVMKSFELPNNAKTMLQNIGSPNNREQGMQNRVFRPLLTR